ncbi:MAG: hypothetical protein KatS3mg068_1083 [Candidatus Sericytochromatia bacterium]|nr:MAG: hypothetical protein KatS3mg068_1083 [Candidatus Sericytochromatia bacterium]
MNNFRTEVNVKKFDFDIEFTDGLFFIGSCFSENISNLFKKYKFKVFSNPSGILYNPISISNILDFVIKNKFFTKNDLLYSNNKWISFYHHGDFSNENLNLTLEKINSNLEDANKFLKKANYLFITFGSAFVYELKENKLIVANCHKLNSDLFNQRLLNIQEIEKNYIELICKLNNFNQDIKIIFTVSPIRYLKYGHEQNTYSKSILFVCINELKKKFKNVYYFPSYEIIMDDLRDYRFYNDDMIHPSNQAIEYIWQKLINSMLSKKTISIIKEIDKILLAKNHIPFNPCSNEYKNFCKKNINLIEELEQKYDFIDFKEEKEFFLKFIQY